MKSPQEQFLRSRLHIVNLSVAAVVIGGLGLLAIITSHADTFHATNEAETGQLTGNAGIALTDLSASGGQAVRFGLKDPNPNARNLIIPGLADPDIYKVNDNLFFVSGTRQNPYDPFPLTVSSTNTTLYHSVSITWTVPAH